MCSVLVFSSFDEPNPLVFWNYVDLRHLAFGHDTRMALPDDVIHAFDFKITSLSITFREFSALPAPLFDTLLQPTVTRLALEFFLSIDPFEDAETIFDTIEIHAPRITDLEILIRHCPGDWLGMTSPESDERLEIFLESFTGVKRFTSLGKDLDSITSLPNHQLKVLCLKEFSRPSDVDGFAELIKGGWIKKSTRLEVSDVDHILWKTFRKVLLLCESQKIGFTWIHRGRVKKSWSPPAGSSSISPRGAYNSVDLNLIPAETPADSKPTATSS